MSKNIYFFYLNTKLHKQWNGLNFTNMCFVNKPKSFVEKVVVIHRGE